MEDLTTIIKLVMLIEQIPSIDGSLDTDAKILTEASIWHRALPTLVLDFLAKAIEVLNCGKVTALFGLWLIVYDGGDLKESSKDGERLARERLAVLMCCQQL